MSARTVIGPRGALLVVSLVALTTGCATVKSSRVRPDYEQVDRTATNRLLVVTAPNPASDPKLGELWSTIARRYTNTQRDFIAKESRSEPDHYGPDFHPASLCADGLEGVLWLVPDVARQGERVKAAVRAQLVRCSDGQEVWAADAEHTYDSKDEQLKETTAQYVSELGPEVEPYVAPTYRLLKATLDTLPKPTLDPEEVDEKIEYGE